MNTLFGKVLLAAVMTFVIHGSVLAAQGYMAIAVDPPGTGFSARPDGGYDTGAVAATLHTMMN